MQPFKYNPNNHSGQFKHRITFLTSTITEDELGQVEETFVEFKKAWAMIKTVKGTEFFGAAATQNENTYRFVIGYMLGIAPTMKINFKDRTFDIESVLNDDEANKTLTVIANERSVGNG